MPVRDWPLLTLGKISSIVLSQMDALFFGRALWACISSIERFAMSEPLKSLRYCNSKAMRWLAHWSGAIVASLVQRLAL